MNYRLSSILLGTLVAGAAFLLFQEIASAQRNRSRQPVQSRQVAQPVPPAQTVQSQQPMQVAQTVQSQQSAEPTITLYFAGKPKRISSQRFVGNQFIWASDFVAHYAADLIGKMGEIRPNLNRANQIAYDRMHDELAEYTNGVSRNILDKSDTITYHEAEIVLSQIMGNKLQNAVNIYNEEVSQVNDDIVAGLENVVSASANYLAALSYINRLRATNPSTQITVDALVKNNSLTYVINGNHTLNAPTNYYAIDHGGVQVVVIPYPANYRPAAAVAGTPALTTKPQVVQQPVVVQQRPTVIVNRPPPQPQRPRPNGEIMGSVLGGIADALANSNKPPSGGNTTQKPPVVPPKPVGTSAGTKPVVGTNAGTTPPKPSTNSSR